ncbi:SCO family protein [Pleionea sp. CnH1-48]|uniref:SCO family protein n=1 Tax=Pleionea sp. CnH1-48 TaxID=2954494 RepID=UPI002097BC43|nr:SCO family protein [Pleionea sp. CnH1-48]MCO7224632.1 SCO family protein [Pleionea sp. CnH1-48]
MNYLKQTLVIVLITAVVTLSGVAGYQYFSGGASAEPKDAMVFPKKNQVNSFALAKGDNTFTDNDLKGKWSFLFFGYTYCPDVCPVTMAVMRDVYAKLEPEVQQQVQVVLVSVDPERDSPQHLQKYAQGFHPEFIGVTAEHTMLEPFAKQFGAIYFKNGDDPQDYLVDHTAKIFLVDPDGKRHAIFDKSLDEGGAYRFNEQQMALDFMAIRSAHLR